MRPPARSIDPFNEKSSWLGRLAAAILLIWLGLTAYYLVHNFGPNKPFLVSYDDFRKLQENPMLGEGGQVDAMGIYIDGEEGRRKIGYSLSSDQPTPNGRLLFNKTFFILDMFGQVQKMNVTNQTRVDAEYRVKEFRFDLDSSGIQMKIQGEIVEDGKKAILEIVSNGGTQKREIALKEPPFLSDGKTVFMAIHGKKNELREGQKIQIPIFEPMSLSETTIEVVVEGFDHIQCGDKKKMVVKLSQKMMGQLTYSYMDQDGNVCREESPQMGMVMEVEPMEEAMLAHWDSGSPVDLVKTVAVSLDRRLEPTDSIRRLVLETRGDAPLGDFMLNRPNQGFANSIFTLERPQIPASAGYRLPNADPALAPWLIEESFLQSNDPVVIEKARRITHKVTDPIKAAHKIYEWLWKEIEKTPVVSLPNAKDVLATMRGDCNEHAILFAALGRAVGLPTRVVSGLVYLDGMFYYHAWNEVWLGQWIAVDATLGQWSAHTGHIALVEGGIDQQARIMSVLGRLEFRVKEVQRGG